MDLDNISREVLKYNILPVKTESKTGEYNNERQLNRQCRDGLQRPFQRGC
jgi:hypothetical protein